MKKLNSQAHVSKTGMPMGDFYGSGIKNKIGRVRDNTAGINPVAKSKLKKPPRSLA